MEIDLSTSLELTAELGEVGSMNADFAVGQVTSGIDTIKVNGQPLPVVNKSVNIDLQTPLSLKQDKLTSGVNIKTINSQSIIGTGNINIEGGAVDSVNGKTGNVTLTASDIQVLNSLSVQANLERIDDELGRIQDEKQDLLVSGLSIKTINDESLLGSGNIDIGGQSLPIHVVSTDEGYIMVELLEEYGVYVCADDYLYVMNQNGAGFSMSKGEMFVYTLNSNIFAISDDAVYSWQVYDDDDITGYEIALKKDINAFDDLYASKMQPVHYPSNTLYLIDTPNNTREDLTLDATSIIISRVDEIKQDNGIFEIIFTSPATATTFNYPNEILWSGDDLVNKKFVPVANKRYWVTFRYDGKYVVGDVRGASL